MPIEVRIKENLRKKRAIELRKRGFSYSDIRRSVEVPKSTLASWLKGVALTEVQRQKLNNRRSKVAKDNSEKKILNTMKEIERIKASSLKDVGNITMKELWLMGIALYWRERFSTGSLLDLKKGVQFSSSNPFLIKLFLKWLRDVGKINNKEIAVDIFIKERYKNDINRAVSFWSDVTELPKIFFTQIYIHKNGNKDQNKNDNEDKKSIKKDSRGFLRLRVKESSMMARQIAGWIEGIKYFYWGDSESEKYDDYL